MKPNPIDIPDTLMLVSPEDIPSIWLDIEHYLKEANDYGGSKMQMHHWLARLLLGPSELFVSPNLSSAVICEPQQFDGRRVYGVILLGGEGKHDWREYQRVFEQQAISHRCDAIEIFGRKGWKNILEEQLGYQFAHWVWRKELKNGW